MSTNSQYPGAEVDFVLTIGRKRFAIDVTSSERLHDSDFRGLRAISELGGLSARLVVYAGSRDTLLLEPPSRSSARP